MTAVSSLIELDGAHGEGGGGLVRTAIQMAALTQTGVRIVNIRGGTNHPGLDVEDSIIINAAGKATHAEISGGDATSHELIFQPTRRITPIQKIDRPLKQSSRNANALVVLATLISIYARSGGFCQSEAEGETFGPHTLTFDYLHHVGLAALRKMGVYCRMEQTVAGFGRESFGRVSMEVEPSQIEGLNWDQRGQVLGCHGVITTSELPEHVFERGRQHLNNLSQYAGVPISIEHCHVRGSSPGAAVTLWAEFENGLGGEVQIGSRGLRIETVVQAAFEAFSDFLTSGASVDSHLIDLLLIPSVFANDPSIFRVSRLTKRLITMIWVVKQFLPIRIMVVGEEGEPGLVTVRPIASEASESIGY